MRIQTFSHVVIIILFSTVLNSVSLGVLVTVYLSDGQTHIINDNTYQNNVLLLDWYNSRIPGTRVHLVDGGFIGGWISTRHHASITITGGTVQEVDGKYSITMSGGSVIGRMNTYSNCEATILGGSIGVLLNAQDNSTVNISGGLVNAIRSSDTSTVTMTNGLVSEGLVVYNSGSITVSGGTVDGLFEVLSNGTIYLDGENFEVDGQALSYGNKLSDIVPLTEHIVDGRIETWRTGTITGILDDGTVLNNTFRIYSGGLADIIIIPEPATLLLVSIGAVMIRRKQHNPSSGFKEKKVKKTIVLLILLVMLSVNPVVMALTLSDGQSHTIDTYFSDLDLDPDNDILPGTHVNLIDGGVSSHISLYHHATIDINGGTVNTGGIHAEENNVVTITDGLVMGHSSATSNSTVNILGGDTNHLTLFGNANLSMYGGILGAFSNYGNSIVSIFGGSIKDYLRVGDNGIIYLYGTDFEVNGQTLSYGDHLSDFVPLTHWGETHYQKTGTITGTLADDTALNNTFQIMYWEAIEVPADIIIVPEPATLSLLALGAFFVGRRKRK